MAEQVISLTNRKKIPMGLPNGQGGQISLEPGETKLVRGDLEHYRRMPAQGMNGLVVKLVEGKSRLVEAEKKIQNEVRLVRVTNHRNIPMRLATGLGHKAVNIGPREASEPFLARVSTVKQMTGITVRLVEEKDQDETPENPPDGTEGKTGPAEAGEPRNEEPSVGIGVENPKGNLKNSAGAEVEAIARQAAQDQAMAKAQAEADDPLLKKRRDLALPATGEEWKVHKEQLTWPDVRGIAKELGVKAGAATKAELVEAITKELYPGS